MRSISKLFSVFYFVILTLLASASCPSEEKQSLEKRTSTLEDRKDIAVTVYNSDLALVKETRDIKLPSGRAELRFMDVAARIKPSTVIIKSLSGANSVAILEQNYEYDLLSPQKLLDKFIGQKIRIIFKSSGTLAENEVEATLLSNNNGYVFQVGKEIRVDNPGAFVLPKIPENLIAKPTLVWLIDNGSKKEQSLEVSYLTNGMNWNADYVALLNKDDSLLDLSGWVTLSNTSGAAYDNAQLKLVAGDVNIVRDLSEIDYRAEGKMARMMAKPESAFKEEGLFEYHLYTLDRRTTLKDNETKQVSLLNSSSIPVKKEFLYYGDRSYFRESYGEVISDRKVGTYVMITNSKKNRLGMPLPKGIVRAYKADSDGNLQFIGEDRIDHTPKDEEVKIKLGDAFDIVAERKQTEYKLISPNRYSVSWQVTVKNHKEEDVTVGVVEPIWGDWEIVEKSHDYEKVDANTIRFDLKVPKNGKAQLNYKVNVRYTW